MENCASKPYWGDLYTGPWIVDPQRLEFWESLLESYSSEFHLNGIDVWGIGEARQVVEQQGWGKYVTLQQGMSGYVLSTAFAQDKATSVASISWLS